MSTETAIELVEEIQRQIDRHKETGWVELDPEKRAFAAAYLLTPIPRKAAEEAGLPAEAGTRMYKDPITRAYISHLQELSAASNVINVQWMDNFLLHLVPIFMGEEEAPTVVPGVGVMDTKKLHGPELMKLLDMMAKRAGYYNADISQGGIMAVIASMQEFGRKAQLESEPVDPRSFRVIENPDA